MTQKLYHQDMYQKEFKAKVIAIQGNKIVLDKTCFFIQGSGQSGDSGEINGIKVVDTQKGGFHILAKQPTFKIGDEVSGKIDWDKRYKTMRLHSASHVVEHFIYQLLGKKNILKTNVNPKQDLSDYEMEFPNQEIQDEITKKSNDFVSKNLEIAISVDDHGMHHWICDEIRTLCTGTHVKNTSEIGTIFILFEKKNDNTTRVLVKTSE